MVKRYRLVGLLLGLLLLGAAVLGRPGVTLAGDVNPAPRTVEVTGRGTVSIKYDTALVTFGVSAIKDSPSAAYDAMSASINSVVAAVQAEGVKADDLKTGVLSLNAEYDWVQNEGQRLRGYRATNTITLTTQQLDKVAKLAQVVVAGGANQLQGISFTVKNLDAVIDQATDAAVDDAKARADRVAKRLGTSVQGVMRVTVGDAGGPPRPPIYAAADAKATAAPAPIFSGTSEMTITVNATFELK
jgi:uncharacterized protein YggE